MARITRAAIIQASNALPDTTDVHAIKQAMIDKHVPLIAQAAEQGAQICCLQEIFSGPYFCAEQDIRWYETAEPVPDGPTVTFMQQLAKEHGMIMVVPIYEQAMTGVYYNTAAVIDADGTYLVAVVKWTGMRERIEVGISIGDEWRVGPLENLPEGEAVAGRWETRREIKLNN